MTDAALFYVCLMCFSIVLASLNSKSMKVQLIWYDAWIGYYWSKDKKCLYILPIPFVVFSFDMSKESR